jgi:hypothetical protein
VHTGAVVGVVASVTTATVAPLAQRLGVRLTIGGYAIPAAGFPPLTFTAVVVGTFLAVVTSFRAAQPRDAFVTTTIELTVLSIVADVLVDAHLATRLTLAMTQPIAAATVIPAVTPDLSD